MHVSTYCELLCHAVNGFCDEETVLSKSGTTYVWSETLGGQSAMFTCPFGEQVPVTRNCSVGGVWSQFNETICGTSISGQLNTLVDLFSNVRR